MRNTNTLITHLIATTLLFSFSTSSHAGVEWYIPLSASSGSWMTTTNAVTWSNWLSSNFDATDAVPATHPYPVIENTAQDPNNMMWNCQEPSPCTFTPGNSEGGPDLAYFGLEFGIDNTRDDHADYINLNIIADDRFHLYINGQDTITGVKVDGEEFSGPLVFDMTDHMNNGQAVPINILIPNLQGNPLFNKCCEKSNVLAIQAEDVLGGNNWLYVDGYEHWVPEPDTLALVLPWMAGLWSYRKGLRTNMHH